MKITETIKKRMTFSFEVFPPKTEAAIPALKETLAELYRFRPDFISCTYGAGGTNAGLNRQLCRMIKESGKAEVLSHFTCVGHTRAETDRILREYADMGVEQILALRGDIPAGWEGTRGDFDYAVELTGYIREHFPDMSIGTAGYPEKHIECDSFAKNITHLRMKQDAGAGFIVTQLGYDMEQFQRWHEQIKKAGVNLPVIVGVMPVLSKESVIRMTVSNGCAIPRGLSELIGRYGEHPEDFKKAGKEYTIRLINSYVSKGIDGLHIYTMNRQSDVSEIVMGAGIRTAKE